ncbi:thioredoxin domain-containing protein [Acuticoccus sp. I52.16.1]|uniref:thioredoxin domain-containing protein n=1 Tax=Acuticoccus sp. I52.16.1 TaxID=2928472 RepID=UPI001FD11E7A|nr:thioredoxin domain-containing protein [Acuticoccus sp. I52.16.1]UOM36468.1 thioredoxin domain-containing protein [Acuticoccus sp. I52.16.1]
MANRLAHEASPYLLQHADNPVDWWPWSPEALAEAERSGKPILLSVGYAACHWCHVMAHESFEDEATAEVMNARYVNIKVDREERPDIDQIYMSALHATGEQGGWPLTMFLTSAGEPFFGGTYFPKDARFGRAAFIDVLTAVADAYSSRSEVVQTNVTALRERISAPTEPGELPADTADKAAQQLLSIMDPENGGTRGAPKFPNAGLIELLWRAYARTGDDAYRTAVTTATNRIAMGGITDHVGGGLARYSVDGRWHVPHFEKMLYDNAQMLGLYAEVAAATGSRLLATRCQEIVTWLTREMEVDGLFAASLDADSEGEEGRFYLWSLAALRDVLGADTERFAAHYGATAEGNWEGTNVLHRLDAADLADDETETFLTACRDKLLVARERRPRPARDDKALADWNGLMIAGLARAGGALQRPDWLDLAERTYATARDTFEAEGRLIHAVRGPVRLGQGFALDYAAMIHAALTLVAAGRPGTALADAERWCRTLRTHYAAPGGGYYWTADDADALILRPESPLDEAVPNANGLMVKNLATLWALTGEEAYEAEARAVLRAHARALAANVFGCASLVNGLDQLSAVTVTTSAAPELRAAVLAAGHPAAIVVDVPPEGHPLGASAPPDGSAVVCRHMACGLPIVTPDALTAALWGR